VTCSGSCHCCICTVITNEVITNESPTLTPLAQELAQAPTQTAMSVSTSSVCGPLTYDEALSKQIGQLGWGQWRTLLWASLPQISAAAAFFLWVFVTVDPVANHYWSCTDTADSACAAVWQQEIPSSQSFCSLNREQWQWTNEGVSAAETCLCCT
jgi:hypothetical protein